MCNSWYAYYNYILIIVKRLNSFEVWILQLRLSGTEFYMLSAASQQFPETCAWCVRYKINKAAFPIDAELFLFTDAC